MASGDRDVVPLLPSHWDAILAAAKDQLPSLDSDSSWSDCEEEEPFIFQRNQPVLIPDLAEVLAEDPAGVDEAGTWDPVAERSPTEPMLGPVGLATKPRSGRNARTRGLAPRDGKDAGRPFEGCTDTSAHLRMAKEIPTWLEGDLGSLSFNTEGSQSPPWASQGEATLCPEGEPKTESLGAASRDSAQSRALRRERRRVMEKDMLQKVTRAAGDPACGEQGQAVGPGPRPETPSQKPPGGGPVLSLQQLEEWDLDYILQSLPGRADNQGDHAPRTAWWLAERCQGQDHTVQHSRDRLLEQLTLLCATQARACASAQKVPADTPQDEEERKARGRCAPAKPGSQTAPSQQPAEGRRQKTEPPTIFIDLRQPEPRDHPSPESSGHSSGSEDEGEDEDEETAARGGLRDCTGKSQLLQQLRAFRKVMAPPKLPASEVGSCQKAQASEDAAGSGTGRKEHVKLWAERQSTQARCPGGHPRALGDPVGSGSTREAVVPALGQL